MSRGEDADLEVPLEFICPLSDRVMAEPVIIASGLTYEREYIQAWFDAGHMTCPRSGEKVRHTEYFPNVALKALIMECSLRTGSAREVPRNSDDGAGSSGSEMAARSRRQALSTLSAREREAPGGREADGWQQRRRSHEHQPPSRMVSVSSREAPHEGSGSASPGRVPASNSEGLGFPGGRAAGSGRAAAAMRAAGMDSGGPSMARAGTAPVGGALERKKGPVAAPHLRPDRRRTMSWDGSNDPLAAGRLDPSVLAGAVVYDRAASPVAGSGPHPGREPRPSSSGAGSLAARRQRRLSPLQASGQLTGPLVNSEAVASPQLPPRAGGGASGAGVRVSAREGAGGGLWSPQEQASGAHGRGGSGGAAAGGSGAAEMQVGPGIPRGGSITASSPRHRLSRGSSGGISTGASLPPLSPQVQQVMQHGHTGQQQGSQVPLPRAMTTVDGMVEAMDRGSAEQRVEAVVQLRAAVKESCENRQRLLEREDGVPILLDFLDEAVAALGGGGGRAPGREGRGRGVMDPALVVDCAVAVVLQLCQSRDGAAEFIDVGGVPSLVDVLSHTVPAGTAGAGASAGVASGISSMVKGNAAAALFALSSWDDVMDESVNASRNGNGAGPSRNIHKTKIQAAGAIPSLVRLLTNETARCRKDAGLALFSLSQDLSCANEIVREGAVSILVDLLGDKRPGVEEKAMAVLANLARTRGGQEALLAVEGTLVISDVLESESERAREEALWTLHHLVTTGVVAPAVLLNDGALFPIAKLACKKGALAEAKELHRILMTARKGGGEK
ncbi:unnamed protein product [Closterium sp. Naga37s-1]|nr:unnamed protein product [Closterium sp. Naga37s-1]